MRARIRSRSTSKAARLMCSSAWPTGLRHARYRHVLLECHPAQLAERHTSLEACLEPLRRAGYRGWWIDHTAAMHRRAASAPVPLERMLVPFEEGWSVDTKWPHLLWLAPRSGVAPLMRVAYVSVSDGLGGSEIALVEMIAAIRRARPDWPLQSCCRGAVLFSSACRPPGRAATSCRFRSRSPVPASPRSPMTDGRTLGLVRAEPVARRRRDAGVRAAAAPRDRPHRTGHRPHQRSQGSRDWRENGRRVPLVWHMHEYIGRRPLTRCAPPPPHRPDQRDRRQLGERRRGRRAGAQTVSRPYASSTTRSISTVFSPEDPGGSRHALRPARGRQRP